MVYLVPRDPFNITSLRRQMDELFDSFFPFSTALRTSGDTFGTLTVDVVDNEKEYVVKADLPGLTAKDVEVRVTDEQVTIKGEYSEQKEEKNKNYVLRERRSGSFLRTIPFGVAIDPDKAKATFKNGVLELVLPKAEVDKRQGKQLRIQE